MISVDLYSEGKMLVSMYAAVVVNFALLVFAAAVQEGGQRSSLAIKLVGGTYLVSASR